MIDTKKLTGLIYENGRTKRQMAKELGMTEKTFYAKMKRGVFDSDEIYAMVEILGIKNPIDIFFAAKVT